MDSEDSEDIMADNGSWVPIAMSAINGDSDRKNKPNVFFKNYRQLMNDLVHQNNIKTLYSIVNMGISNDSKAAFTVTKKNDREYYVKMYDIEKKDLIFEEVIGGKPDSYIKAKDIEQNEEGTKFALCFFDDGKFRVRYFDKSKMTRTDDEIQKSQIDVNSLLKLDNWIMVIDDFSEPFMNCCFLDDERLYVCLFYTVSRTHYHFIWNMKSHSMVGQPHSIVLDCSLKNFPYKSFYNDDKNEIYTIYRQGQSLIINGSDITKVHVDRITELDLG